MKHDKTIIICFLAIILAILTFLVRGHFALQAQVDVIYDIIRQIDE